MSAANMAYASCSTCDALSSGALVSPASSSAVASIDGAAGECPQRWPPGSLDAASFALCENTNDASSCMPCRYPSRGFSRDHTSSRFSSACWTSGAL